MTSETKAPLSIYTRSVLFYLLSTLLFLPFLAFFWVLFLPRWWVCRCADLYLFGHSLILRFVCGIRVRIVGREHVGDGPILVASQHESAWETLHFHRLFNAPVMFAKKEVFAYPVLGGVARKMGHIPVDRRGSADAVREGFRQGAARLENGDNLLIFPSGTRSRERNAQVQSGVGVLYAMGNCPAIPVLLNSGDCWPADTWLKFPGTIHVEIRPAIPAGLNRKQFLELLVDEFERPLPKTASLTEG